MDTTKVTAIRCPSCKDIIYSRARHDFHGCTCGDISVDGGLDYLKYNCANYIPMSNIEIIELHVAATPKELYDDWNYSRNNFGLIKS